MYIDPNSGGQLFQILAVLFGLFSGILLIFSSKIRMLTARLRRGLHKDEAPPPEEQSDESK